MAFRWNKIVTACAAALLACHVCVAGDHPCGATVLDPSTKTFDLFSNAGLSDSGIDAPPYGGYSGSDIWFEFTMPASGIVHLMIMELGLSNPAVGIYAGPCDDPKLLYNVLDDNCDGDPSPGMTLNELDPGETYYIRIWAENGSGDGTFTLFLSESVAQQPGFILHSDAAPLGDCILLTPEQTGQHGCAWFEIPMDFSQPFVSTMTANFGDKDADGADGITLIYQANGPDYCGNAGGGIGAEGMPMSAIFEFDTYQNGNYNDPFDDHVAFNINGNMNHANSINGPITLGNIEDGLDHTIHFVWDGSSYYELYFDGILVLSGNYDFINNLFGGNNLAWWGYTSATGALTNEQIICPEIIEFELGTQSYVEVEICEGESYNGYTQDGFYIDFEGGGNCQHQVNTRLIVHPVPAPVFLADTICEGEVYFLAGQFFFDEGQHMVTIPSLLGCDSTIYLDLEVIEGQLQILTPDDIDCLTDETDLISNFSTDAENGVLVYDWTGPTGNSDQEIWTVGEAGTYVLDVFLTVGNTTCYYQSSTTVYVDTLRPELIELGDVEWTCDSTNNQALLDVTGSIPAVNVRYQWYYQNNLVGSNKSQEILGPGFYRIILTDEINGCTDSDTVEVTVSDDRPFVQLSDQIINCDQRTAVVLPDVSHLGLSFKWSKDGQLLSTDSILVVDAGGSYSVEVTNDEGCSASATTEIRVDTLAPIILLQDTMLACDIDSIYFRFTGDSSWTYSWTRPDSALWTGPGIWFDQPGLYVLSAVNPKNGCRSSTAAEVRSAGKSPGIQLVDDTLTCDRTAIAPDFQTDQDSVVVLWTHADTVFAQGSMPLISEEGIYVVQVTSKGGCVSKDTLIVSADRTIPVVELLPADTLDCQRLKVRLSTQDTDDYSYMWKFPDGKQDSAKTVDVSLKGTYFLEVVDDKNGCSFRDSIEVYQLAEVPRFEIGSDTLTCNQKQIKLPFELLSPFQEMIWTGPQGITTWSDTIPTVDEPGLYRVHIEAEGNCVVDTAVLIHVDTSRIAVRITGDSLTCAVPTVTLSADWSENPNLVIWTGPGGTQWSGTQAFDIEKPGWYTLTVAGSNGCVTKDSVQIAAFQDAPAATAQKSGDLSCINDTVLLTVSGSGQYWQYEWSMGSEILSSEAVLSVGAGGEYVVHVVNEYGCSKELILEVDEDFTAPAVSLFGSDLSCQNETSTLYFEGSNDIVAWQWSGPSHSSEDEYLQIDEGGTYSIEVVGENGCSTKDSIEIETFFEEIIVHLLHGDTLIVDYDDPAGRLGIGVVSEYDYTVLWTPATGLTCTDCLEPEFDEDYADSYRAEVWDVYGCSSEVYVFLREKERPVRITVPNVFSPNKDGFNDGFTFYGPEHLIDGIEVLEIFDRWGNKVFHGVNLPINNERAGWDGLFNGRPANTGVYIYSGAVLLKNGERRLVAGDVTLIR